MTIDLPAGYRRVEYDDLPSTSQTALGLISSGDPGEVWVTAGRQTMGRGRRGRRWSTEAGNLAASLALVDPADPEIAATLSFAAGVALHQAVVTVLGPATADRLALKWPNDLLLDRHKIAGILIEGEVLPTGKFGVVMGIGVNCVSHPELDNAFPASDLTARGLPVTADHLFGALADCMAGEIRRWDRGSGFAATRKAWLARAIGIGEPIVVRLADRSVEGQFHALDDDGRLILRHDDGRREKFTAGDVFFSHS
jgi:BirA family biotin operon repressor/biotin-[acetyl-CoA-carboxylase] ligase